MYDLVISGGTAILPDGPVDATICVSGGRIAALAAPEAPVRAAETLDATGFVVMPGLVDAHVHFREPGLAYKEGVADGSRAAAAGGVTTIIIMPTDDPMTAGAAEIEGKVRIGADSMVDYAINVIVGHDLSRVSELAHAGACTFDLFLGDIPDAYLLDDPAAMLAAMQAVAAVGGLAGVTPLWRPLSGFYTDPLVAAGRNTPADFAASRPPVAESAGIALACELAIAAGCRTHFRQVSCAESVAVLRAYRSRAPELFTAETLPHNLVLDDGALDRFGPFAKMSPPLRPRYHSEALWQALKDGIVDIVVTDHAPHSMEEKERGRDNIWKALSGIPGLETFLPAMLEGYRAGDISLSDIARWCCEKPAKLFGLVGKGEIAVGCDADLIVFDPAPAGVIEPEKMLTRGKYTPFAGRARPAPLHRVFLRGRSVLADGVPVGEPAGQFLPC